MKQLITTLAKWTWFVLLVLVAFGYMASGLSETKEEPASSTESNRPPTNVTSLGKSDQREIDAAPAKTTNLELQQVIQAVNLARSGELERLDLPQASTADWMTICRRMSLALVGSGMSLQEIRGLEELPESDRESAHLQSLLRDPRFHDYWAERWTRFLVGADEGPFVVYRRRRFRHWLSQVLAANRPYDKIVRDLITAEGLWTDKPQVNFLTVTFDSNDGNPDPVRLAARTSRAFLGLRIDCLQCHNDFLGNVNLGDPKDPREGLQTDFHGLAAFFSSAKTTGLQGVRTDKPDYNYKFLDATEEVSVPAAVPYSPELLPDNGDARKRLATWVTHPENRQFSRAAVARFWALMFGKSPTEAVDNLPLDDPLPVMLEPIVEDFRKHHDVRRTIQIIVQSDAFRVDSVANFDITPGHEDHFSVFPLTRLRAEQMAASVAQAARIKSINRDSSWLVQLMRFGSVNDFLGRYGDLGENEFSDDGITIPQRLVMLNGKMLHEAGQINPVLNTTSHINMFAENDVSVIDTAYLCLLNRYPTSEERSYFMNRIARSGSADADKAEGETTAADQPPPERGKAVEDLFWTLANSTEFAWNH